MLWNNNVFRGDTESIKPCVDQMLLTLSPAKTLIICDGSSDEKFIRKIAKLCKLSLDHVQFHAGKLSEMRAAIRFIKSQGIHVKAIKDREFQMMADDSEFRKMVCDLYKLDAVLFWEHPCIETYFFIHYCQKNIHSDPLAFLRGELSAEFANDFVNGFEEAFRSWQKMQKEWTLAKKPKGKEAGVAAASSSSTATHSTTATGSSSTGSSSSNRSTFTASPSAATDIGPAQPIKPSLQMFILWGEAVAAATVQPLQEDGILKAAKVIRRHTWVHWVRQSTTNALIKKELTKEFVDAFPGLVNLVKSLISN